MRYFPVFGLEKTPYLDIFHAVKIKKSSKIGQGQKALPSASAFCITFGCYRQGLIS